jgi:hypothetical protein
MKLASLTRTIDPASLHEVAIIRIGVDNERRELHEFTRTLGS